MDGYFARCSPRVVMALFLTLPYGKFAHGFYRCAALLKWAIEKRRGKQAEAQCDWDDFFPTLEEIDFNGKLVALFGCGDQEDYAEYFCDALGTIRDIIEPRGATIVGHWPTAGYHFEASKGLADDDHFVGLAIDEDRQPELTNERVEKWVKQVAEELHLEEIKNA